MNEQANVKGNESESEEDPTSLSDKMIVIESRKYERKKKLITVRNCGAWEHVIE